MGQYARSKAAAARSRGRTFQAAVWESFDRRIWTRRGAWTTTAAILIGSMAIHAASDPIVGYALLFALTMVAAMASHHWLAITQHEGTRWQNAFLPIAAMLGGILLVWTFFLAFRGFGWAPGGQVDKTFIAFQFVVVGLIEEWYRWTALHILPASPITANAFWVVLHPQIGLAYLSGNSIDASFAIFALGFSFAAFFLMWAGESIKVRWRGRYVSPFGLVAAITLHGAYNVLVIIWSVEVGGVEFFAF